MVARCHASGIVFVLLIITLASTASGVALEVYSVTDNPDPIAIDDGAINITLGVHHPTDENCIEDATLYVKVNETYTEVLLPSHSTTDSTRNLKYYYFFYNPETAQTYPYYFTIAEGTGGTGCDPGSLTSGTYDFEARAYPYVLSSEDDGPVKYDAGVVNITATIQTWPPRTLTRAWLNITSPETALLLNSSPVQTGPDTWEASFSFDPSQKATYYYNIVAENNQSNITISREFTFVSEGYPPEISNVTTFDYFVPVGSNVTINATVTSPQPTLTIDTVLLYLYLPNGTELHLPMTEIDPTSHVYSTWFVTNQSGAHVYRVFANNTDGDYSLSEPYAFTDKLRVTDNMTIFVTVLPSCTLTYAFFYVPEYVIKDQYVVFLSVLENMGNVPLNITYNELYINKTEILNSYEQSLVIRGTNTVGVEIDPYTPFTLGPGERHVFYYVWSSKGFPLGKYSTTAYTEYEGNFSSLEGFEGLNLSCNGSINQTKEFEIIESLNELKPNPGPKILLIREMPEEVYQPPSCNQTDPWETCTPTRVRIVLANIGTSEARFVSFTDVIRPQDCRGGDWQYCSLLDYKCVPHEEYNCTEQAPDTSFGETARLSYSLKDPIPAKGYAILEYDIITTPNSSQYYTGPSLDNETGNTSVFDPEPYYDFDGEVEYYDRTAYLENISIPVYQNSTHYPNTTEQPYPKISRVVATPDPLDRDSQHVTFYVDTITNGTPIDSVIVQILDVEPQELKCSMESGNTTHQTYTAEFYPTLTGIYHYNVTVNDTSGNTTTVGPYSFNSSTESIITGYQYETGIVGNITILRENDLIDDNQEIYGVNYNPPGSDRLYLRNISSFDYDLDIESSAAQNSSWENRLMATNESARFVVTGTLFSGAYSVSPWRARLELPDWLNVTSCEHVSGPSCNCYYSNTGHWIECNSTGTILVGESVVFSFNATTLEEWYNVMPVYSNTTSLDGVPRGFVRDLVVNLSGTSNKTTGSIVFNTTFEHGTALEGTIRIMDENWNLLPTSIVDYRLNGSYYENATIRFDIVNKTTPGVYTFHLYYSTLEVDASAGPSTLSPAENATAMVEGNATVYKPDRKPYIPGLFFMTIQKQLKEKQPEPGETQGEYPGQTPVPEPTPTPTPEPEPEPEPEPRVELVLTPWNRTYKVYQGETLPTRWNITNIGNTPVTNISIGVEAREMFQDWNISWAMVSHLDVNETKNRTVFFTPGIDTPPGIYVVPVVAMVDNEIADLAYIQIEVLFGRQYAKIQIIESPEVLELDPNTRVRIPVLLKNIGKKSLHNITMWTENLEDCIASETNPEEDLDVGETKSVPLVIETRDKPAICEGLLIVGTKEGAYSYAPIKLIVRPRPLFFAGGAFLPVLALLWTLLLIIYAVHRKRTMEEHHMPPKANQVLMFMVIVELGLVAWMVISYYEIDIMALVLARL